MQHWTRPERGVVSVLMQSPWRGLNGDLDGALSFLRKQEKKEHRPPRNSGPIFLWSHGVFVLTVCLLRTIFPSVLSIFRGTVHKKCHGWNWGGNGPRVAERAVFLKQQPGTE